MGSGVASDPLLTHHHMCLSVLGQPPRPPMPWENIPLPTSLWVSIPLGEHPCAHIPLGEHPSVRIPLGEHPSAHTSLLPSQLLPAPTWDATDSWDSSSGNTCQRETVNLCSSLSLAPPTQGTPSWCSTCRDGPDMHPGCLQHPSDSTQSKWTQRGLTPCLTHRCRGASTGGTWHPWVTACHLPHLGHPLPGHHRACRGNEARPVA